MPNRNELIGDLEFDQKISAMKQRELLEFVARQTLEQSKDIRALTGDVANNKKRSMLNRFLIIALVVALTALGVIRAEWFVNAFF